MRGDVATVRVLVAAGADVRAEDHKGFAPCQLADGDDCRDIFRQLATAHAVLQACPVDFIFDVAADVVMGHSTALTEYSEPLPYQLDPPFLWAPLSGRSKIYEWARSAFIIHAATVTEPFIDLPDDCAGDVLDYTSMSMSRLDALCVLTHFSSPEAHDWVRRVLLTAIAVSTAHMGLSIFAAYSSTRT